jgi:hypothetical protein
MENGNMVLSGPEQERELAVYDSAIVRPVMSLDAAREMWAEYQHLENDLLQDSDYIYFMEWMVGDKNNSKVFADKAKAEEAVAKMKKQYGGSITPTLKRRKTKSAFRKMAKFFGLYVPEQGQGAEIELRPLGSDHFVKVEKGKGYSIITYMDERLAVVKAEVTVAVSNPAGKTSMGVAACSDSERKFTHPDHDIMATAWTRAVNRAVSDLVGWGEVSAEELVDQATVEGEVVIEGEVKAASKPDITVAQFLAEAFKAGWTMDRLVARYGDLATVNNYTEALEELRAEGAKAAQPAEQPPQQEDAAAQDDAEKKGSGKARSK